MGIKHVLLIIGLISISVFAQNPQIQQIRRIGNELKASVTGVDVPGAIFLLNEYVLTEGVVFAFSAFFRSNSAVRFQIWRPIQSNTSTGDDFMLVGETSYMASVTLTREDVYIESKLNEKCILVKTDDRIGVYFEKDPGAIAYTFDSANPTALGVTLQNVSVATDIGDVMKFNTLAFPYDFSVAAYVYTNLSGYNTTDNTLYVDCPKGMLIPNFDTLTVPQTTLPPITGRPGNTGATGPQGGLGSTGAIGPQGQMGANGTVGEQGGQGGTGATGQMGMNGTMGDVGPMGSAGATGAVGPKGDKGDVGAQGPRGPPGPVRTLNGTQYPSAVPVTDESFFSNPWLVLALLIWLVLVTISIIIISIVLCCCYCCKSEDEEDKYKAYDNNAYDKKYNYNEDIEADIPANDVNNKRVSTVSYLEGQPSWVNTMKSTSESMISVNTIEENDPPPKGGNHANGGTDNVNGSQSSLVNNSTDSLTKNGNPPGDGRTEF